MIKKKDNHLHSHRRTVESMQKAAIRHSMSSPRDFSNQSRAQEAASVLHLKGVTIVEASKREALNHHLLQ